MTKLLLTGASGFVGSFFVKEKSDSCLIQTFSFQRDHLDKLSLDDIDVVVHLAAYVHHPKDNKDEQYRKVNYENTVQLAEKAKVEGVKHFVFMSTIKVYGEEAQKAYTEVSPCHPLDSYGKSKLEAEKYLLALADNSFKVSIIRTPIVYGEGVKANIFKLIQLTDKCFVLPFGGITNKRSMVYVGNLTHMISEVIGQEKDGIFLASDDLALSTSELIKEIVKNLSKKRWIFKCITLQYLIKFVKPGVYRRLYGDLYLDNSSTVKRLSLTNPYTSEEGITNMVSWYRESM